MKTTWFATILITIFLSFLADQGIYAQEYLLGDIPLHPEVYKKNLKVWPMDMAEALPIAYDARDEGIVTTAKNQGSCGSCWAFASVGSMESHLLKLYGVGAEDLSEQQQVSCNISMAGCNGGSSSAIRYWESKGPLYEDCFGYTALDTTPCSEKECIQLGYRVVNWHTVAVAVNDFKSSLYTYGPSYWRYDVHQDFYDYWNYGNPGDVYINQQNNYKGGHAVLLIGWDDTKGAYLCKNSWGETGGPNNDGTFWIAYSGHSNDLRFGMANFSLTAVGCASDADCDDGIYCNGSEICVGGTCQNGSPPVCSDDGLFCNGSEVCDEVTQGCGHSGDPCTAPTVCNEETDQCKLPSCGNNECDEGENCNNCPEDCISGTISGDDCNDCFKGNCDGVCHPKKDGPNCPDCATSYCCGDGLCEGNEDNINCAIDCGDPPVCGDEICDDGVDNDCDGYIDCDDSNCALDPACNCGAKKSPCDYNSDCCSNRCSKKGVCL